MKEIKTQTIYICPETGKKCHSRVEAERSARKAIIAKKKALELAEQEKNQRELHLQKKDWIRLNLTDVNDIPKLVTEKAKEFFGIDCEINVRIYFGNVSNSHGAPIGKKTNWSSENKNYPTHFLGWSGRVSGTLINYKGKDKSYQSVSSVLFSGSNEYNHGFRGFHTGTGCPGDCNGQYPMDIGFYFFLEDFPLLQARFDEFKRDQEVIKQYNARIADETYNAIQGASAGSIEYMELEAQINQLKKKQSEIFKSRYDYLIDEGVKRNPKPKISQYYDILVKNFNDEEEFKTPDYFFSKMF